MVQGTPTLRDLFIGMLLFGTLLTGMLNFSGEMFNAYDVSYENDTLTQVASESTSTANETVRQLRNSSEGIGQSKPIATGGFFLNKVWQTISTTISVAVATPSIMGKIVAEIPGGGALGWIVALISGIVFAIFAYEALSLYRGLRT